MSGCEGQVKEIFNCMTAVTCRPTLFFLHHFILFHIHSLFFFLLYIYVLMVTFFRTLSPILSPHMELHLISILVIATHVHSSYLFEFIRLYAMGHNMHP